MLQNDSFHLNKQNIQKFIDTEKFNANVLIFVYIKITHDRLHSFDSVVVVRPPQSLKVIIFRTKDNFPHIIFYQFC